MDQAAAIPEGNPPPSTLEGLRSNFPFPTVRHVQELSMQTTAEAYDGGKQFTALEIPTGGGKSGIAVAAARWSASKKEAESGAHYLTSQNSLSRQLVNDFGGLGLVQIRGRGNYRCVGNEGVDCETGSMLNGGQTCNACPYRIAKNRYLNSKLGVTNYTYYLTETMYSKELTPREFLILDEAHNIEKEILSLVDLTITQRRCDEVGIGRLPVFNVEDESQVRSWLSKVFLPGLRKKLITLELELEKQQGTEKPASVQAQKEHAGFQQLLRKLLHYLEDGNPQDWLAWSDTEGRLVIKPLTAEEYANRFLFEGSPHILMMSATILDFETFRRNLGIPTASLQTLAVPSEFPKEHRRIVYWPVGSMSYKNIEATLPRLAERSTRLLDKFADKKAMIHTHTYRINNYLWDAFGKTAHRGRIVSHTSLSGDRERAIASHIESSSSSVLMSPSMTEGLDLKDELARLQIITKVPYPFLDPYNRTRMQRDPKWYQLQTALSLVQATGRTVRSEDDYALTIILDQDFERFLAQNQDILPEWWLNSIEFR